jgi:hypothetical protein
MCPAYPPSRRTRRSRSAGRKHTASRLHVLVSALAALVWLAVVMPAAAQQDQPPAPAGDPVIYRYQERIALSGQGGRQVWDTLSLQQYVRRDLPGNAVQHEVTPAAIRIKSPEVGLLGGLFDPDKATRYLATVTDAGGIDWQQPMPTPGMVSVINEAVAGRTKRNLNEPARVSTTVNLPVLGYEAKSLISVEPVVIQGLELAVLTYDTGAAPFVVGNVRGRVATKAVFVISRDFKTLFAHASEHRGEIDAGDGPQSFRLSRSLIRLDSGLRPTLQAGALPAKFGFERMADLRPLPDGPYKTLKKISIPSPIPPVLSVVTATVDARLGAEAEQNENIFPLLGVVVVISTIDTADSLITTAVHLAGHATGNEKLVRFEGVGKTVFRAAGETVGKLAGAENPEKWGDAAALGWGVTTFAANVVTVFKPDSLAKTTESIIEAGGKTGKIFEYIQKGKKFLEEDRIRRVVDIAGAADKCWTAIEGYGKGVVERYSECAWSSIKAGLKDVPKLTDKQKGVIGLVGDGLFLVGDASFLSPDEDEEPAKPAAPEGGTGPGPGPLLPGAGTASDPGHDDAQAAGEPPASGQGDAPAASEDQPVEENVAPRMPDIKWPPS